jgi:hypothetical protein
MSLSVCLLTRNEEKNLARAIGSVSGFADEVLVADTGSTDRTVAVAAAAHARVVQVGWNDDFAGARDAALRELSGDWVLWLNPDEEFVAGQEALRQCVERADVFGFYLRVQELSKPDQAEPPIETYQLRLFRRRADLHSVGRLHPRFEPSLEDLAVREGLRVEPSAVTLRRHAYLSQLTESKLRWVLRLLELELRDRPGQLHYLIEYGRTLLLVKDPRAHAVLSEAAEQVWAAREAPRPPLPDVQRLLEYLLTVGPEYSKSRLSRTEARELALRWYPQSPPLLWRIGEQAFRAGDYRQAAEILERLLHLSRTGMYDRSEPFDPRLLGESAVLNLGLCYARMGEADKAETCFLQLLGSTTVGDQAARELAAVQASRSLRR